MPEAETGREEELRSLLTDAIEVQLAALKAGISFWSEWIEEASSFVQSATDSLSSINSGSKKTEDALLELLDKGRASARTMTEIPRHTATRFIEELDAAEAKRTGAKKTSTKKTAAKKTAAKKATKKTAAKKTAAKKATKKTAAKKTAAKKAASKKKARPKRAARAKE
jgi:hypothetical protein